MALNEVLVRREGGAVIATLNRPEKLNALNKEVYEDLNRLVDVLYTDKTARLLVITGSGEKAFSVGADLKERQGMNEKDVLLRFDFVRSLFLRLENLPIPVLGAINGMAYGGGLELALACDFRMASENATFTFPEVDLAIIPGTGGTQRLPRLIGMAKSLELILLCRRLNAAEALAAGLLNKVVPQGQIGTEVQAWASKILEAGPIATRQAKRAIRMGMNRSLEDGLNVETESYRACLYSKDRLEGLKAFSEKRKPVYVGE